MFKYKEWSSKPESIAVLSALGIGLMTHMFGLVNVLHNNDDITVQPAGFGTGLSSGRWFLELLGNFTRDWFGNYNLPWMNGILFLVLLALSAGFVVSVFQLKKRLSGFFIGAIFITFPAVISVMFYRYTVFFYGVSVLLAVLAAWFMERYRYGIVLAALCMALSLGIYQAYIPITISIYVLLLIQKVLNGETDALALIRRGLAYCASIILGLILYFVFLHGCLSYYQVSLSDYQGVSSMGQLGIKDLLLLMKTAIVSFYTMPFTEHGNLAQIPLLTYCYIILGIFLAGTMLYLLFAKVKEPLIVIITLLLTFVAFPLAADFTVVMCPESLISSMFVYAFALLLCIPFLLMESKLVAEMTKEAKIRRLSTRIIGVVIFLIIFSYIYLTNVNYTSLYYTTRQTETYFQSILVQARMTEGFDADKKWAFVGDIEDPMFYSTWEEAPMFRGNTTLRRLVLSRSKYNWFKTHLGVSLPRATDAEMEALIQNQEVMDMPCWPAEGSIKVIDDTVVIKFQELSDSIALD